MARRSGPWSLKKQSGYWYVKLRGETVYHSTGILVGNERATRPKATAYADRKAGVSVSARSFHTFGDYAGQYFGTNSCPWFVRERGRGNEVQEYYRNQHKSRLDIHITPQFGNLRFDELTSTAIEHWLYRLDYSTQWKKHIYSTLMIILADMKRDRLIEFELSEIKPPMVRHTVREVLSDAEASTLFPEDLAQFRSVWKRRFVLGVFSALAFSSGLRTSELRALRWPAIKHDLCGLVVVITVNRDGNVDVPKAKSVRAVPLPKWTMELLDSLPGPRASTYVFPGHSGDTFLDIASANHALQYVCSDLRRDSDEPTIYAHITPHGLRHSYNTRMRALLAEAGFEPYFDKANGFQSTSSATDSVLRAFTGHRTANMTELYDHPELLSRLEFFNSHFRKHVDRFWEFRNELPMAQVATKSESEIFTRELFRHGNLKAK